MAKLILKFKDKLIKEYVMPGDRINIGRQADNHIVINNTAVSKHHVKIELQGGEHILTDLNSTNGTFVNEKKTRQTKLKDGDRIILGKHTVVFVSENQTNHEPHIKDFGMETMVLDTKQQKELLAKQLERNISSSEGKNGRLIITQSGIQKEYKLTKKTIKIGKSPASDVVITGFLVPSMAATIKREGDSYFFNGYGGWINIKVNGKIAGKNWKLEKNDIIEIRRAKIVFKC